MLTARRHGTVMFLAVWAGTLLVGLASLMVGHVFSMPPPGDLERLRGAVLNERRDSALPLVLHVIYDNCSCTDSLIAHLAKRGPRRGYREQVLFVGAADSRFETLLRAGYRGSTTSRELLKTTFALEAAPVMVVLDSSDTISYVGGYYLTSSTVNPQDAEILEALRRGELASPLPVYGCAVSAELQSELDPLSIRY